MLNAARYLAAVMSALLGVAAAGMFIDSRPSGQVILRAAGLGTASVALLGWMVWSYYRPGKVPDFLLDVSRGFLDGNGVSFLVFPSTLPDRLEFEILFQNRYEGPCDFTVVIRPNIKGMSSRKVSVNPCPGGAFGRAQIEFHLLEECAHTWASFAIGAGAKYPQGAGSALLFREGTKASSVERVEIGLLDLVLGSRSRWEFELPAPQLPAPAILASTWEILWKPGDPLPEPSR